MSRLTFHKCHLCGRIFYSSGKYTYCSKCIPKGLGGGLGRMRLSELSMENRRALERERWHRRMANPEFREKERKRSLARARADRKYAKLGEKT